MLPVNEDNIELNESVICLDIKQISMLLFQNFGFFSSEIIWNCQMHNDNKKIVYSKDVKSIFKISMLCFCYGMLLKKHIHKETTQRSSSSTVY